MPRVEKYLEAPRYCSEVTSPEQRRSREVTSLERAASGEFPNRFKKRFVNAKYRTAPLAVFCGGASFERASSGGFY